MLKVVPKSWLSWDFAVEDAVGMPWGEVGLSSWRERGSVSVGGQQFGVARQGLVGPFVLQGPAGPVAEASKPSAFKREFTLSFGGQECVLKQLSWWRREFGLLRGDVQVGSITPESWWSRRAEAMLPEDMPTEVRAFIVWLTLLMWKRDSNSGA